MLVGVSASFSVNLVGTLFITEIIILMAAPFLILFSRRKLWRSGLPAIFLLLGLWLLGQVLTDIYRETARLDWMRGQANIAVFGVEIAFLVIWIGGSERLQMLFIGSYALGSLLAVRLQPSPSSSGNDWKFGYSTGVILLVVLISCYFYQRRRYVIVGILLGGLLVLNLFENFRSPVLFLLIIMALLLPIIPERIGRLTILRAPDTARGVIVKAAIALIAAWGALHLVHLATAAGLLGEEATSKNQVESQAPVGILFGGRPEIFVSSQAVMHSPLLGYGSWAKDLTYAEMLYDITREWGLPVSLDYAEEYGLGLIPTHSYLMGAWVWAGILGAVFWAYIFILAARATFRLVLYRPPLAPVYGWFLITLMWNILFSPFGSSSRMTVALSIVIILYLHDYEPVGHQSRPDESFRPTRGWVRHRVGRVARVPQ